MRLDLTYEEISYMLTAFPSHIVWPQPYESGNFAFLPAGEKEVAGGVAFRLKVIAARQWAKKHPQYTTYSLDVTLAELWLIEHTLGFVDFSTARMQDKTPVLELANKVWDYCVLANIDRVVEGYLPDVGVAKVEIPDAEVERRAAFLGDIDRLVEE